jgi:hypothetical protein
MLGHCDRFKKNHRPQPAFPDKGRTYTMGADLANRGCAGLDESIDINPSCTLIVLVAQVFLCSNEINNPIRECFGANTFKQRRKFEVGMKVDQSRHENCVLQPDNMMAGKPFFYVVFRADRQNGPPIDNNRAILYEWDPGSAGEQF